MLKIKTFVTLKQVFRNFYAFSLKQLPALYNTYYTYHLSLMGTLVLEGLV